MNAAEVFYDTNVVLYLLSAEAAKAERAEELLAAGGRLSVQVLNEFASVASRKLGMDWPEIGEILAGVRAVCPVESIAIDTHERGLAVASRYGLNIYDAMIVASALLAGCKVLYSEDLQHGQVFERQLTVRNPFAVARAR
jgi:predicted nucleic acid-binding protein